LASQAALALGSMLGRQPGRLLDLAELEAGLRRLGVAGDLDVALAALGHPPSPAALQRRNQRRELAEVRQALRDAVASWPEPWSGDWATELVGSGTLAGLSVSGTVALAARVRRLLDVTADPASRPPLVTGSDGLASRTDLAAALFGSAHALDTGTRLERAASRALSRMIEPAGETGSGSGTGSEDSLWEGIGYHRDRVSAPVLTWGLDLAAPAPLAALASAATSAGVPVHLSVHALLRHPVLARPGATVLVAENPRVVEAAAGLQLPVAVIATNGNPTRAVTILASQLLESGATLHYHGDFDAAGIGICRRMADLGCRPWRMGAADYAAACERAAAAGVELPIEESPCGPTPWDPALEREIERLGRAVHEELVLAELLGLPPVIAQREEAHRAR
jgi:uncharacterized protein (TIGR02679 family)